MIPAHRETFSNANLAASSGGLQKLPVGRRLWRELYNLEIFKESLQGQSQSQSATMVHIAIIEQDNYCFIMLPYADFGYLHKFLYDKSNTFTK